jgi:hypothetical protein
MFFKNRWIFVACMVIGVSTSVSGQISGFDKVGTTSFTFLQVVPNARVSAMGGVYTVTLNTSEAAFFNPAGLTRASDLGVSISYLDWFIDVKISSVSMNYRLGRLGSLGVQAMFIDMGEIEETQVAYLQRDNETGYYNPGLTGNLISPGAYVVGLSFARDVTERFTFGLTAKYAREDLVEKSASALIFDGGVIYRTGYRSLVIGTALRNFGKEIKYYSKSYPLPQTFTIGISGCLFAPDEAMFFQIPNQKLLMAFDLSQTRDHSQQQHIGIEYSFNDLIFLRGGYKFNHDEENLTLGFGVSMFRLRMDYAYNDFGEYLSNVHRFTLGFDFK